VVQATLAALETHRLTREDQRHDAEQDEEADHREVRSPAAARAAIRLALTGPLVDRAGRRLDTGRIAPLAKARRDDVADDAGRHRVGDGGLEAIADFQADSALGEEDDQDDAVVEALLADAPALGQLDRDVVDALALGGAEDGHRHLGPGRRFALGQEPLEAAALVGGERVRGVVDARRGRGRGQEGEGECNGDEQTMNVRGPEMAPDALQRSERAGAAGRAPRPPLICPVPRTSGAPKWPPTPSHARSAPAEPDALLDSR